MSKTIVVCGYGSGISDAVAQKFGAAGFTVALVARNKDRLETGAAALTAKGIKAAAFPTDLSDAQAVKRMIADVRAKLGPVTVVHYNAYTMGAPDLTTCDPTELVTLFNVGVTGLVSAVQAALPDLKTQPEAAVLVTGGGFAFYDPAVDAMATQFGSAGMAIGKAAQHKTVGLLAEKLKADNVYVGEVVVTALVKGTAFDHGNATLEPGAIADRFWELYSTRTAQSVTI